jgi:hypothetical protein
MFLFSFVLIICYNQSNQQCSEVVKLIASLVVAGVRPIIVVAVEGLPGKTTMIPLIMVVTFILVHILKKKQQLIARI